MAKKNGTGLIEGPCAKIAEEMGYELVDLCLDKEPGGLFLRFYIDRPEGITLDDCEHFHKRVMPIADQLEFDYMEVSSPGIDRPLKKDRDFDRNLGAEIEIRLYRPFEGNRTITGTLAGLADGEILVNVNGTKKRIPRKDAALVKPLVDMTGIEDVDLGGTDDENA